MNSSQSHNIELNPDETLDMFLDGRIKLIQPRWGYRFSADSLHLARFATIRKDDRIIDLGTGCGIIMMIILSIKKEVSHIIGIEIQKELASQAQRNIILNGFETKASVIMGDIRDIPSKRNIFTLAICNPPYHPVPDGRINPDTQKAIARHEITLSLDDILNASKSILRRRGRLAMIYPPDRLSEIIQKMREKRFEPKRIQFIFPGHGSEARLMLIEGILEGRPGIKILPPIFDTGHQHG